MYNNNSQSNEQNRNDRNNRNRNQKPVQVQEISSTTIDSIPRRLELIQSEFQSEYMIVLDEHGRLRFERRSWD